MPPHIDLSFLERFCQGDRLRMAKYIALYLAEAPAIFAELQQGAREQDVAQVAAAAHNLRPMMHQMGAQRLMDLVTSVEERANEDETTAIALLVQDAMRMATEVETALRAELGRLSAG
ncbi:MAG: Hpt domain-containing protein [Flavobacteriales bacterium]|nr:Hpt domain-containing protein [Flavobacteriales bacterium]